MKCCVGADKDDIRGRAGRDLGPGSGEKFLSAKVNSDATNGLKGSRRTVASREEGILNRVRFYRLLGMTVLFSSLSLCISLFVDCLSGNFLTSGL
jgi:hypothetical protein